jgi:2-phospho-L-lactate transferase/gluconeogenesis factor (CofD/UPF0052 family)
MGVKRWLVLLGCGLMLLPLGVAYLLVEAYRAQPLPELAFYLTLQFIPRVVRGVVFLFGGVFVIYLALVRLDQAISRAVAMTSDHDPNVSIADRIYEHNFPTRKPSVLLIGGGTGLLSAVEGLRSTNAVDLSVLVPICATANELSTLHRLIAHSPTRLIPLLDGDADVVLKKDSPNGFHLADRNSDCIICDVEVVPKKPDDYKMTAGIDDGRLVPTAEAIDAIREADLIVLGPGSIYTHVVAPLKVTEVAQAVRRSHGRKVYVANLMTEPDATPEFSVSDHIEVIRQVTGVELDYVLVNNARIAPEALTSYAKFRSYPVEIASESTRTSSLEFSDTKEREVILDGAIVLERDLAAAQHQRGRILVRHDGEKLAKSLVDVALTTE